MPLNCKPGDLAMVIKGSTNAGKMVQCKQIYPNTFYKLGPAYLHIGRTMGSVWVIDRTITWIEATTKREFELPICPDSWLMPIRPEPEEDTVEDTEKNEV